jgi:hypothetical protein
MHCHSALYSEHVVHCSVGSAGHFVRLSSGVQPKLFVLCMLCTAGWTAVSIWLAHHYAHRPPEMGSVAARAEVLGLITGLGTMAVVLLTALLACALTVVFGTEHKLFESPPTLWALLHMTMALAPLLCVVISAYYVWYDAIPQFTITAGVSSIPYLPRDTAHQRMLVPAQSLWLWPAQRVQSTYFNPRRDRHQIVPVLSSESALNVDAVLHTAPNTTVQAIDPVLVWLVNMESLEGWESSISGSQAPVLMPAPQSLTRIARYCPLYGTCILSLTQHSHTLS